MSLKTLLLGIQASSGKLPTGTFKFQIETTEENQQFTLPLGNQSTYNFNFIVDWGDGTSDSIITSYDDDDRIHTFVEIGTYDIELAGTCEILTFGNDEGNSHLLLKKLLEFTEDMGFKLLSFYECSNLNTIIPLGNFNSLLQISFPLCTSITTIPSGMFDNSTKIIYFPSAFYGCTGITSIPVNLFKYNTKVISFSAVFRECIGLVHELDGNMFLYNTKVTNFEGAFYGCIGITGSGWGSGNIPETVEGTIIYNAEHQPIPPTETTYCFKDCDALTIETGLPIPVAWK